MRAMSWRWVLCGVAAAAVVGCNGGDEPTTPDATTATSPAGTATASVTAPATPTAAATGTSVAELEAEISAAYLAYWDAYAEALLHLDPSLAEEFATGEELDRISEEIQMLEADGVAARLVIEHDFAVINIEGDTAVIIDEFLDRSFYVDPKTKEPETVEVEGDQVRDTFHLERQQDGAWQVVRSLRERG